MYRLFAAIALLLSTTAMASDLVAAPPLEPGWDRPGMDYRSFNIAASPLLCQQACNIDARCRAFTYVRPGVQGPTARCWLKHSVPMATRSFCCSSGIR